jgi:single-strand DNA-binding protein
MGRLTRDPDVRWTQGQNQTCVARYTLAVDRRIKKTNESQQTADYISMASFGSQAEFIEKYIKKGTKIVISGHIQTGSYTNKDGVKVYTTDVITESVEFAESKKAAGENSQSTPEPQTDDDGFMNVPDEIDDELPFS